MSTTPNVIKESSRGYATLSLDDIHMQNRKIFLTDEITNEVCSSVIKQLLYLDTVDTGEEIIMYINSPGGEVTSGLAVYDMIRLIKSPVTTIVTGTAASMGSILFLSGDKRLILPNSKILIHDPSYGWGNLAGQKPHQIKSKLDDLVEVQEKLCGIIAERTGKTIDVIKELTKEDTFFTAEEALDFGLATAIYGLDNRKEN